MLNKKPKQKEGKQWGKQKNQEKKRKAKNQQSVSFLSWVFAFWSGHARNTCSHMHHEPLREVRWREEVCWEVPLAPPLSFGWWCFTPPLRFPLAQDRMTRLQLHTCVFQASLSSVHHWSRCRDLGKALSFQSSDFVHCTRGYTHCFRHQLWHWQLAPVNWLLVLNSQVALEQMVER